VLVGAGSEGLSGTRPAQSQVMRYCPSPPQQDTECECNLIAGGAWRSRRLNCTGLSSCSSTMGGRFNVPK
jgi:hypothetical protein